MAALTIKTYHGGKNTVQATQITVKNARDVARWSKAKYKPFREVGENQYPPRVILNEKLNDTEPKEATVGDYIYESDGQFFVGYQEAFETTFFVVPEDVTEEDTDA